MSKKVSAFAVRDKSPVKDGRAGGEGNQGDGGSDPAVGLKVVGIGSSAGGLEALRSMLQGLEPGIGCAFIVVQHLSPTYKSHLTALLGRDCPLPVVEISSGERLKPDHVFITPPNCNVSVRNGLICLNEGDHSVLPRPSVNILLDSIASEYGDDSIAVVLSGTGSDGATGVRAVKAAGGFTFAQQPDTARYDGMPASAIDTGCIDWILPPERIAREIVRLCRHQPAAVSDTTPGHESVVSLRSLLSKVRARARMDFSGYKPATLWRRIERRMIANRVHSMEAYLALVDDNPEELERLAKDVLISVTSFMRDPKAFVALESALRGMLENKPDGSDIRVWIPGCATGEEAYSVAIMLHRILGDRLQQCSVQIFATDVDMDAMQIARRGRYSASSVAELGREMLQQYFQPVNDAYEIVKPLRELVVFARQDLVLDPPFLRLDLISCRNVLIYLQNSVQSRILSLFNFALAPDGILFLGKSESVSQQDALFVPIEKEQRIFRRGGAARPPVPPSVGSGASLSSARSLSSGPQHLQRELRMLQLASQFFMPDCVLVDAQLQIRHVFGNAGGYLQLPSGRASLDLLAQLPRALRAEVQSLLRNTAKTGKAAFGLLRMATRNDDQSPSVRVSVRPFALDRDERMFLVAFDPVAASLDSQVGSAELDHDAPGHFDAELEHELVSAREHLQTLVEELETSNEEMQALNEEVQAANEELQATNEELEASNEELQSTNEELLTINDELLAKTAELASSNAALELIQKNVGMPLLVVDDSLSLLRFNDDAADLFRLHPGLMGGSLERLALPPGMPSFVDVVRQAIAERTPSERIIESESRAYLLRVNLNFQALRTPSGAIVTLIDQTDRLQAERLSRETQLRLEAVMRHSPILVAIKDLTGRYTYANPPFKRLFGDGKQALVGNVDERVMSSEVAERLRVRELQVLRQGTPLESIEEISSATGELRRLQAIWFPLLDDAGEVQSLCVQALDITDRSHAEAQLKLAALVIDRAAEAVMVTDAQKRIITVNKAFSAITGYSPEEAIGQTPALLKSGKHDAAFYREMWRAIDSRGVWQGEIENRHKDGSALIEWLTISVIHDDQGRVANYVALFSDISEIIESRRRMEHLALHDELTGLPNRTLLLDRLRHALARAERQNSRVVLMFVDLDNFKDVNDSLGHEHGDQLLTQLSERLLGCVREQDTVARLGGDEFTVMLEESNPTEAEILAIRIQQTLNRPFVLRGNEVYATASIGIALFPEDGSDLQGLMQSADTAMYRAKQRGRNTFCYSTEDLRRISVERLAIQNGLRQARESGELGLVFQPLYAVEGRRLVGCEALMRWSSPGMGVVGPARFIPIAEESGQIIQLTEWLIGAVLRQIAMWRLQGLVPPRVSVNISPLHFRIQSIGELVMRQLAEHGLPSDVIGIEITESAMSLAPEQVSGNLLQLKGLGVPVSLDDFGTGYSSLSRLSRLPIDTVKIDREFIDGLDDPRCEDDAEITRTIILMAHSLGMKALAEGVETQAQLDILERLGCDYVQGVLLGAPMAADELARQMSLERPDG